MKDSFGNRMKDLYENRTRYLIPRKTYTVIRLDGKAFHTLTKKLKCKKPFDATFMSIMDQTALYLCKNIQNCKLAYVQSDEISLLLTDFDDIKTELWFDGNIQKMASIAASMASVYFYSIIRLTHFEFPIESILPVFDARIFTIPNREEVVNYFIWRQKDCIRNSIQMLAQSLFYHKELQKKSTNELQEMCFSLKGKNWNDCSIRERRGGFISKQKIESEKIIWKITDSLDFHKDRENFKINYILNNN